MHISAPLTRDLVLVGGGHTHALVMRKWGMDPQAGVRLTVVNPGPTAPYSGMLPGHVAGHYTRDELDIDLVRLARFAGARLIDGAVTRVEAAAKQLHIAGYGVLPYDVASLDVGVHAEMPKLPGFPAHGVPAKPLGPFATRWRDFLEAARQGHAAPEVAVIGAGVAGVELSMACAFALRAAGRTPTVTLLERAARVQVASPRARARLLQGLRTQGVTLRTGVTVTEVGPEAVHLADGSAIPSRFTIGSAGPRPHSWLAEGDLPLDDGFVRVDSRLRVQGHPTLFATGDCAHLSHAPRPKAGVYAVRAAPVLHTNLRAALSGGSHKPFEPQGDYLKLVSLGEQVALGEKFGAVLSGPWVWRLKNKIDQDFMDQFRHLPAMAAPDLPRDRADGVTEALAGGQPLCAGCGSKLAPGALRPVLADLGLPQPGEDAAILNRDGVTQVQSTDHLRAFTQDPVLFARIATVHALGDIWAMGGHPDSALATVILPQAGPEMQRRLLSEILGAVTETLQQAGAKLVGGHSLMGAEMSLGLSVTGTCPRPPITLAGAQAGDALILTRPLGSGTILAAEMAMAAPGHHVLALLRALARPQGEAAAILAGAHAMTDVTGFGLAGHLQTLCQASGVGAEITLSALPTYAGATDLAAKGIRSTLYAANLAAAPVDGAEGPRAPLLHDPQTAGGLLAALPADAAEGAVTQLRDAGYDAAHIGTVIPGPVTLRCV